jgi:hypothetical protein
MTITPRKPLFSSNYQLDILICLGLVLAIFIPYHQVAGHRFVDFDDGIYAYQNTYIIRGLSWDSICWAFTNTESANWHPLTWISNLVDRELFGAHAGGYLLENVAWHALATCLCYVAFWRTTRTRLFAFSIALIFALHPANVETVAWLSERKSLLNAVFWFCAIISYIDFIETRSFRSYGVTIIAYLLSLMSKAMSVTLPCTLILIHILYLLYHPERRAAAPGFRHYLKKLLLPVVPLLLISVYFSAVTVSAQAPAMAGLSYPIGLRCLNVIISYGRYLEMFFHPTELAIFYPLFYTALTIRAAIPSALVLFLITTGVLSLARKEPRLLIGWCWFLGTMVPVIGLVQVGSQSHADRYLYIPMLGLAFVFPVLFDALRSMSAAGRRILAAASLLVLGVSMTCATQVQVSYWKDGVSLFRHSLAVSGDCLTSVYNLTVAYGRLERFDEMIAFADSKIAVATVPENKGRLEALKGIAFYAIAKYKESVASAENALKWGNTEKSVYWTLAISNYQLGRFDEAAKYLTKAKAVQGHPSPSSLIEILRDSNITMLEAVLRDRASAKSAPALPPAASTSHR